MAFPNIAASNSGTDSTGATSHTIQLPSGISSGDLLLVFVVTDGNPTLSGTLTTEYTQVLNTTNGTAVRVAVYAKSATGSEGSTVALTTSASEATCFRSLRIPADRWKGGTLSQAVESATATGTSTTPNPPSLNPTNWDVEDTLWIAGHGCDANRTTSAYPTNFSSNQYTTTVSNATNGCGIALATRENAAASEDPGTFTISNSDEWVAYTIAVRANPIVAGGTTSADGASTASSMAGASTAATGTTAAAGASTASTMAGEAVSSGRPSLPLRISRLTSSRHAGRKAGTFFGRVIDAGFTAAAGTSTASAMVGYAPNAGSFVAAAGASTSSTMVGDDDAIGLLTAAAGASTASAMQGNNATAGGRDIPLRMTRLTSLRHAGRKAGTFFGRVVVGGFLPAGGGSVVSSLAGSGAGAANFSAADGVSTAAAMAGADTGASRSLGRITRGNGVGWSIRIGGEFSRVNGADTVAAAGLSTPSVMATSLRWDTSTTPAAGLSTAATMAGRAAGAADMVPADGVATTALAGGGITSLVNASGASTTGAAGGSTAATAFVAAEGAATGSLAGSGIGAGAMVAAAGSSATGDLYGSDGSANPQVGVLVPAQGAATGEMAGASTARANFVAAAGVAVGEALLPGSVATVNFTVGQGTAVGETMAGTNAGGTVVAASFVAALGETVCPPLPGSKTTGGFLIPAQGASFDALMPGASTVAADFGIAVGAGAGATRQGADANNGIAAMTMTPAACAALAASMFGRGMQYARGRRGGGGRPRREMGTRGRTGNTMRPGTGGTTRT